MKTTFEIIKGKVETVEGLSEIVEVMYYEGIEAAKMDNGKTLEVYDNGSYSLK